MSEKPQDGQICLWRMVEGLECQLESTEAINAALRAARDRKGQDMEEDFKPLPYRAQQAIEQAQLVAAMAARLSARVMDYETKGNSGAAALRTTESINRLTTQTRMELLELKELL